MLAHLFSARENTEGTNTGSCQFVFSDVELSAMPSQALGPVCRRRSRFHLVARGRAADMAVADSGRFRNLPPSKPNWHPSQSVCSSGGWILEVTAVGFEPTPFRNGALSHRLRPLGQTVIVISGFNPKLTFLVPQGFHGEGEPARGAWDGSDPRAPIISTISIPSMPPKFRHRDSNPGRSGAGRVS